MCRRILVTSALPYANGPIHLGHLVEYVQTDIWVRYHKLRQHDCVYICADDTHGTPIMIRAMREGIPPKELITRMHEEHTRDFAGFAIGFDNYYSTDSEENRLISNKIYEANRDGGHMDRRMVRQAYCETDGMFLPDRYVRGTCPSCGALDQYGDACEVCSSTYSPLDLKDARCAICASPPVERESEHIFFKLADFATFLKDWTRSGRLQEEMANKLDEWFKEGLKDWDISRDGPYFGFEIPDAPGKYFYVWLDAPIGYMASTMNWCQREGKDFSSYWSADAQAEVYHFIGKDILYFHTLFWPALLHGAGFRTPTAIFAHGFLTVNGMKMSKSRGTFINAKTYLEFLDPEYLRYYYAAKLTNRVDDIDLNFADFTQRVNSDLVGKVVNIAARTANFIHKGFSGQLSREYPDDGGLHRQFVEAGEEIGQLYESREYARAMRAIMRLAEEANRFVESRAPWQMAKEDAHSAALQDTCTVALNLFRILILYLKPVLPQLGQKVEQFFAVPAWTWEDREHPWHGRSVKPFKHLMARVDPQKVEAMLLAAREEGDPSAALGTTSPLPSPPTPISEMNDLADEIPIDDFIKVDLRVARIVTAEDVPGAEKLLKLTLDLGSLGTRTVFAGIKSAYQTADLRDRLTVVVANLKPRKMKFGLSEGMVLAAGPGGQDIFLLLPDAGAQPGMRIK
ncbi:MAG: methionine--tRNA ligase [Magnetococcales bacterium]|nr:methionine--tRNA ligase [Magnetococcales bacterium]MBF0321510.1 methionine--tRNA ligase [Magnetococcales bacterium]